jgi:hypothetical protein
MLLIAAMSFLALAANVSYGLSTEEIVAAW